MHTPGPWELERSITSLGYARVKLVLNKHGTIGFVNMWRDAEEEAEANARLIAAAPCLLEALEELLSHPSDDYEDAIDTDDGYTLTPLAIAERKATEAIRKAKSHADTLKGG